MNKLIISPILSKSAGDIDDLKLDDDNSKKSINHLRSILKSQNIVPCSDDDCYQPKCGCKEHNEFDISKKLSSSKFDIYNLTGSLSLSLFRK